MPQAGSGSVNGCSDPVLASWQNFHHRAYSIHDKDMHTSYPCALPYALGIITPKSICEDSTLVLDSHSVHYTRILVLKHPVALCIPIFGFSLHRLCATPSIYWIHTSRLLVSSYDLFYTSFGLNGHHQVYNKIVDENCCSVVRVHIVDRWIKPTSAVLILLQHNKFIHKFVAYNKLQKWNLCCAITYIFYIFISGDTFGEIYS